MFAMSKLSDDASERLRAFGLTYPGSHIKSPWPGHADLAVNNKTFAYLRPPGESFAISCKLPQSAAIALSLPFATPTEYGLGKSGWVTADIPKGKIPVALFMDWLDESYRAQAPKKLVKELDARASPAEKPKKAITAAKKSTSKSKKPVKKGTR